MPTESEKVRILREALRNLTERIAEVSAHPRYRAVWECAQLRLGQYDGPQYEAAFDEAAAALAATAEPATRDEAAKPGRCPHDERPDECHRCCFAPSEHWAALLRFGERVKEAAVEWTRREVGKQASRDLDADLDVAALLETK